MNPSECGYCIGAFSRAMGRIKQPLSSACYLLFPVLITAALVGCGGEKPAADNPPPGQLSGVVRDGDGRPLKGVMVTALDPAGARSITVFTDRRGEYDFPELTPTDYRLSAKRIGFAPEGPQPADLSEQGQHIDFVLQETDDFRHQLPANHFNNRLVEYWPDDTLRDDFTLTCAGCHQVGNHYYQRLQTREQWEAVIDRMLTEQQAPPLTVASQQQVVDTLMQVFGAAASARDFERPAPPADEVLEAVIYEYEIDPEGRAGDCHDNIVSRDGIVYTERGFMLNPETLERRYFPVRERAHSLQEAPDGTLWITITRNNPDVIANLDPKTGKIRYFELPEIDGERGIYPHTLRFDADGYIWFTVTASNHVARFDPRTGEFRYYDLPTGTKGDLPLPSHPRLGGVPTAYGMDVAPDGGIWWSQLLAQRIGRLDPETEEMRYWTTPLSGPRRHRAGPDGRIWVPFFGPAKLGAFNPETEQWALYELPTGNGELPYALAVNPDTGHVWITGSNSDSMIRFEPETEKFTVFPLPSPNSYTRDVVFDTEGNVWSCTSARAGYHPDAQLDQPRVFKIELGSAS